MRHRLAFGSVPQKVVPYPAEQKILNAEGEAEKLFSVRFVAWRKLNMRVAGLAVFLRLILSLWILIVQSNQKIAANGRNVLKELNDRFVKRRGRRGREPVLFKLSRECFKRIADLGESESDLTDEKYMGQQQLLYLEEFKNKWQDLQARAMHEMPLENAEKSHRRFQESIYLRHFLRLLESKYQLPPECKARKMKIAKCELKALAPSESMEVSLLFDFFQVVC
jgi:hypothetical protein